MTGRWHDGALLVDKPSGPTSHDVVAFARRALKTPRVGHTGTLDPLATGLLVLLVGHATRLAQFLVTDEKEYLADVRLGIATPTYDAQSLADDASATRGAEGRGRGRVTPEQIQAVLPDFLGTFPQLPPPFSAKKVGGVRAYKKARKNEPVELKPVEVTVRELELARLRTSVGPRTSRPRDLDPDRGLLRLRIAAQRRLLRPLPRARHRAAARLRRAPRGAAADPGGPVPPRATPLTLDALEAAGPARRGRLIRPQHPAGGHAGGHADRRGAAAGRERQHAGAGATSAGPAAGAGPGSAGSGSWTPSGEAPVGRRTARRRAFASPPRPEVKY